MADNFCRLCGLGMREEPNAICKSVPHWQAWHEIDLRAAYERGVRAASALFTAHGGLAWRCLDHGGEEADEMAKARSEGASEVGAGLTTVHCRICGGAIPSGEQPGGHTALCAGVVGEQLGAAVREIAALRARAERAERIVGLAWRFTAALGGAKLRQSELDALDPLLVALNAMPMADFARCLESAKALAATGDEEGKGGERR